MNFEEDLVARVINALDARTHRSAGQLDVVEPETGLPLVERLGGLDDELDKVEYRQTLRPLIEALPERERAILMLRFFGDMSQTQIAERVGLLRCRSRACLPAASPLSAGCHRRGRWLNP